MIPAYFTFFSEKKLFFMKKDLQKKELKIYYISAFAKKIRKSRYYGKDKKN